jgi:hypothetical protein
VTTTDDGWNRYGRALTSAMAEVLEETADYWLSVGLVIGLEHPASARRLLALIEAEEAERAALAEDAAAFVREALA